MSEWISVEDKRKPTQGESVLCYGFSGEDDENPEKKDFDIGQLTPNGFEFFSLCFGTVTHWKPLREPKDLNNPGK